MEINFLGKNNKKNWNQFLLDNQGSFLQSFEWGEFQKSLSKKVWRIEAKQGNKILVQTQLIQESFPLCKSHFYIPFGPCFRKGISVKKEQEVLSTILTKIGEIAKREKAVFLKIESLSKFSIPKIFLSKISQKRTQPQRTLVLDLSEEEESIFNNFSSKVRYNIRLAERKGVKIEFGDQYNPAFYSLIKKTSKRDNFFPFDEEHYKKLFACGNQDFNVKSCSAIYKDKIIASYILIVFGKEAICLHGASDWDYRALKAPNLAQWARIKIAKKMGARKIDFWGIDAKKWPGITAFKKGFGGEELQYPLSKDIIFQKFWYKAYHYSRKLK